MNCKHDTHLEPSWYVYIVLCNDKSLYTGITTDLDRRILEHNSAKGGARYTRTRQPVSLCYSECHKNRSAASKREYQIKKYSKKKKLELIGKSWVLCSTKTRVDYQWHLF